VRSTKQKNNKFKKLFLRAYRAELKHRLNQWKHNIAYKEEKGGQLKKIIIDKMKIRLYRQAFDRFTRQMNDLKKEVQVNNRLDDVCHRFNMRKMRASFNGVSSNAKQLIEAKKKFKKCLLRAIHIDLKKSMSIW